jgi:DNA polymerase-3 subunit beta
MAVLNNLLFEVRADALTLTASDSEVEMRSSMALVLAEPGEITVPARKLTDLVKALPDGAEIHFARQSEKLTMKAGRSRFVLTTLAAIDFPASEMGEVTHRMEISKRTLKDLIERVGFAMASADVRYYLNGMLFEQRGEGLRCVATDGHRLALADSAPDTHEQVVDRQWIIPRKGVLELMRLLDGEEAPITLEFARNHVRASVGLSQFTSKLIDGRFPDYESVIPIGAERTIDVVREDFRAALMRASILANEKFRGVRIELNPGSMRISSNNPEQEEAVEEINGTCVHSGLAVGFNVSYLLDAISALDGEQVTLAIRDTGSSGLLYGAAGKRVRHVVMPLRL